MASAWFQATDYFYNKLNQMRETDADYTADALFRAFNANGYTIANVNDLNAAADQLERHFVDYGNAENVSPNNYFDVATYKANKLIQLGTTSQQPPAGFSTWTEDALDRAMEDAGLSYWDHYIQYGTREGINPSAAFDTNDYLTDKLAQLNSLQPPQPLPNGTIGTWTRDDLCDALRDAGWNAVEHYMLYNTVENIGYQPAPEAPARDVELTTGEDAVFGDGVATNFVGTVEATGSNSTLNSADQITGGHEEDVLTVNMAGSWGGFDANGFVKNVPTVDLNNTTADKSVLAFDASNIEGANTYNVNGNVSLSNLDQAGITVNLSNVESSQNLGIGFVDSAVKGSNDTLNLGMDNVRASGGITTNGIENIVINATGGASSAPLKYMQGSTSLTVTGDANVSFGNVSATMKNIDLTDATGNNFVCTRRADQIESIKMGKGDDSFTLRSLTPDAIIDGGAGTDTGKLYNTSGAYQFQMSGVETLNITTKSNFDDQDTEPYDPSASLILDGTHTTGLQTVGLTGGNGYWDSSQDGEKYNTREISLVNYDMATLGVNVSGKNNVDLTITDVQNVTLDVGDGDATTTDLIEGSVALTDAKSVAINVTDTAAAEFSAALDAANATSLTLSNSQNSTLNITGGDLSSVSQVTVKGYGDVRLTGTQVGADAKVVTANAQGLVGGTFTAAFTDNTAYADSTSGKQATLNFTGSTTGKSDVTVDGTYGNVKIISGVGDDVVNLDLRNQTVAFTSDTLKGDLGYGNDEVVVQGYNVTGDFTGLKGVEKFHFSNMTQSQVETAIAAENIKLADGVDWTAYSGSALVPPQTLDVATGTNNVPDTTPPGAAVVLTPTDGVNPAATSTVVGVPGQTNSYAGTIKNNTTITGVTGSEEGDAGVEVTFGDATAAAAGDALNVGAVPNLNIVGGTDNPNSITGTIDASTNKAANTTITTGTSEDTVDLVVNQASNQTTAVENTAQADVALENSGAGTLIYTGSSSDGVSNSGSGTLEINSTGTTGSAIAAKNSGTGEVIVNTNQAEGVTKQSVSLEVSDGSAIINAGNNQTVAVSGAVSGGDGLVLNGNGGNFEVDGSSMSGLDNLTVSNGETVVTDFVSMAPEFTLTTDSNTNFANANMNEVKTLTITNTADATAGDMVTIAGTPPERPEGGLPKTVGFRNVENVIVDGNGNTELIAQLGSKDSTVTMTVENDADVTLGGAGLTGKNLTYNGGGGADDIVANLTSSASGASYKFNLGEGDDKIALWTTQAGGGVADVGVATVNVDLGAGQDTLYICGQDGSSGWADWWGGKFAIEVKGFSLTEGDKLARVTFGEYGDAGGFIGGDSTYVSNNKLTSDAVSTLNGFFGGSNFTTETAAKLSTITVDSVAYNAITIGSDTYAVYGVKTGGCDVTANAVVKLVGVTGDNVASSIFGGDLDASEGA